MQQTELAARVREVLSLDPGRNAIEYGGRWWSWEQLTELMTSLDRQLGERGLGLDTPVGMLLRNRPAHVAAILEVIISGRCVVTINPFQSPEKLAEDLGKLRCPVYLADEQDWESPAILAAVHASGSVGMSLRARDGLEAVPVKGLEALAPAAHRPATPGTAIEMLTSGTTGAAKRIKLAYRSLEKSLLDALFYEAGAREGGVSLKKAVVLAVQPMVHISGIWGVVSAVIAGRAIVLFDKFSVAAWTEAVVRHRPKLTALPPTAIKMIYDAGTPQDSLSSLLAVRSGSAPLDPELQEAFESRYGIPILNAYGATEFAGGVAGWTLEDHRRCARLKRGSVGRAQPGCQLRIVDRERFAPLPPNTPGLLEIKAAQIADGEWLRTTDLAQIDQDGFLYILGRADDAIIRGGFKILPGDVASVFLKHPSVKDAGVVGIKDERLGAVPVAAVELLEGAPRPDEAELLQLARAHLASYMVPIAVKIVEALPRTPSLKISQPGVRALFEGG